MRSNERMESRDPKEQPMEWPLSGREGEDGARCRFRTCDPLRVKQVLYH